MACGNIVYLLYEISYYVPTQKPYWGRRGRDHMITGFKTTYVVNVGKVLATDTICMFTLGHIAEKNPTFALYVEKDLVFQAT